ncbi:MAG: DUF3419 family protein [Phycisphaeraceae bacterium]
MSTGAIEQRVRFEQVRYANCWEDADVLCEALQPSAGRRVLSIASAGDNALALLAEGATVVAADLSTAQLACLELRAAAFRRLDYDDVLAMLGVSPCADRLSLFRQLEGDLGDAAVLHWREHADDVRNGIIHRGRFERYFRTFRRWVLPMIHSRRTVDALLAAKSPAAQREFYDQRWNNRRWRALFRLFFGRIAMGWLGRDPEFFRFVEGNVGDRLLKRVEHGLRMVPTQENPYLRYILRGNFESTLPRYLRPENFERIRDGLDRLTLHHGPIEQAAEQHGGDGFDAFNLSDIFEYIDPDTTRSIYAGLLATARPGARLAYWNTLVPRRCPEAFADRVATLDALSDHLHAHDRAFFYCDFHVEQLHGHLQETLSCIE